MSNTEKKLGDWTPVRKGELYCSPACGARCTWNEFETATKRGAALAAEAGEGWVARVWENAGWHFSVEKDDVQMRLSFFSTGKEYFILANTKGLHPITAASTTAKACIELAHEKAKEICNRAQALMEVLK